MLAYSSCNFFFKKILLLTVLPTIKLFLVKLLFHFSTHFRMIPSHQKNRVLPGKLNSGAIWFRAKDARL